MSSFKTQSYYEDLYDRHTVEWARRGMVYYEKFYGEFESELPKDDKIDRPGNALVLNLFYMQAVGNELIDRYQKRQDTIDMWMKDDKKKDAQISSARLSEEPYCHHCSKQGLRITHKMLMRRGETYNHNNPEEVLFMLKCPHCDKNSTFWEDGTAWKPKPTLCPECKVEMTEKVISSKKALNSTYTCPSCQYSYKDKLDLTSKKVAPDSDFDKDRIHYCLLDKEWRDKLFEIQKGLIDLAEFGKKLKEKEDNKHVYDAMNNLKKLRIPELTPFITSVLEKAGYVEFSIEKPEMGREVTIGFNCLDSKSERGDYESRTTLRRLVQQTLKDTNWRLMSEGIHYRLGYLNGRLRVYENEEDLLKLVEKTFTKGKV